MGPRAFEAEESGRFFGRRRETRELVSLVVAHRVVLLYAASGAGKSSLLAAGLVPALEERGFQVLPLGRIGTGGAASVSTEARDPYTSSVLANWSRETTDDRTMVPETVRGATTDLADFLRRWPRPDDDEGNPESRAVIVDQFEELFTAFPDRWAAREDFVDGIRDALADDPALRIVLAIREDYIAHLDALAPRLPGGLRTRYRLEPLRRDSALAAVTGPLAGTRRSFAPTVAESLVDNLMTLLIDRGTGAPDRAPGEWVEPVQLQVVCHSLWERLPPGVDTITATELGRFGDLSQVLEAFYADAVGTAASATHVREARLRSWIERNFVTSVGTRGTIVREPSTTAGMPNAVVDALEAKRLIRPEARAGARWYELTHDRLIEPIQSSNQRYLAARRRRQTVAAAAVAVPLVAAAVAVPIALRPSNASTRSPFAASWALTPGVRYPSVTQGTVTRTICSLGWSTGIRPSIGYTNALFSKQFRQYHRPGNDVPRARRAYEEDHMIPLELGGHPTAPRNLWPELLPLAFKADRLESALHRSVCEGKLSLSDAQQRIVAYKHVNG